MIESFTTNQNVDGKNSSSTLEANQFEIYLKGIQTPVMVIDTDFNVVYMNQFGRKLLGMKKATVYRKKCYDLFKTEECKTERCASCICMQKTQTPETSQTTAHFGERAPYPFSTPHRRYTTMNEPKLSAQ
ncbi:MAG: PAS domain-containing protein [Candidatus Bathyarchaeia archaeon]|jgi:transcriptional regulator with PAS, ATPase and Fis domain